MTKHSALLPHTVLSRVDGEVQVDLRELSSLQTPLSDTCRFGCRNALERVCECLISFLCQRITFLAPMLMHGM